MNKPIEEIKLAVFDDLCSYEIGARIPTMRDYAKKFCISLGFIQSIIKQFEEDGILVLSKKGQLGTFLMEFSPVIGWKVLRRNEPIIVSMPLLTTILSDGLATAIKLSFEKMGLDADLTFLRGSGKRMTALRNGRCHLVVSSKLVAAINVTADEEVLLELPPGSYIRQSRLYYVNKPYPVENQNFRVAYNSDSYEFQKLTQMEFQNYPVEFIPATFLKIPSLLKSGQVDACICDVDEVKNAIPKSIKSKPLSPNVIETLGVQSNATAIIARSSDRLLIRLARAGLVPEFLMRVQSEVINGERIPEY